MKKAVLRLGTSTSEEATWAVVQEDGAIDLGRGSLSEAASALERLRTTVLVPTVDVLLLAAMIPKGSRQRVAQAIPYAVEELYINEAEEMHFARGERGEDGFLALALTSSEKMDSWTAELKEVGIEPCSMVPDILLVPYHAGDYSVVLDNEVALVRTGPQKGFSVDCVNLEAVLKTEFGNREAEGAMTVHLYARPGQAVLSEEILAPHVLIEHDMEEVLSLFVKSLEVKPILDLLQGAYNRHARWETLWAKWRVPVGLLLLFITLRGGLLVQEYIALNNESRAVSSRIESVYRDLFPDAKKIINPKAQLEHRLSLLRSEGDEGGGFLNLVDKITGILLDAPGFSMQSMRFKNNRLDLGFKVAGLQDLDTLKERMTGLGLVVEIRTATSKGDQVEARMQVKGGVK